MSVSANWRDRKVRQLPSSLGSLLEYPVTGLETAGQVL